MKEKRTILDKIKEENIKQKPKWHFTGYKLLTFTCYFACILIGAASFSVILFSIQQTNFNVLSHLTHSRIELLLGLLPFFWIGLLFVFILLSILVFKKSERGYKYHWMKLFGFNTLTSVILGTLFYMAGGGHQLEHAFAERVSTYESVREIKLKSWMQPENGFLAGTITTLKETSFQLEDFNGKLWDVSYERAFIAGRAEVRPGGKIKLIGRQQSTTSFEASEIRPWVGRREFDHAYDP